MAERDPDDEQGEKEGGRGGRFRRLGRRILGDPDPDKADVRGERTFIGDAREVFGAVLEGGDKAKTEVVKAVAREVRNYLEELGLKDDIHNLITNYSFEIHASVNLRRLSEAEKAPREPKEPRPSRREEAKAKREEEPEGE